MSPCVLYEKERLSCDTRTGEEIVNQRKLLRSTAIKKSEVKKSRDHSLYPNMATTHTPFAQTLPIPGVLVRNP